MKFRRVLAMTFTNKAANEMKERILKRLIQISKAPHDKNEEDFKALKETSKAIGLGEDKVEKNAARSLNAILHNYGMFSVMTIDKFTHKVIRTFARELELSMDFEVELDIDTLQKNVADLLFDRVGRDADVDRLVSAYVESNLEEDKGWNFRESLMEFSSKLFKEDALNAIKQLDGLETQDFLDRKDQLIKEIKQFENSLVSMGKGAMDEIRAKGIHPSDFSGGANSGIMLFFQKIEAGVVKDRTATNYKTVNEDKWTSGSCTKKAEIESIKDLLAQYFHQIDEFIQKNESQYILNKEIFKVINNLSLMKHLLQITEDLKSQENVLLISDFYKKIAEIIASEPVPFIYEQLGVRYDHFLLDEFQDTSRLQWVNLVPLLHDSLSSKKLNLIVGDGKQAIYRWRNGEVEQFVKLPKELDNPDNIESLAEAEAKFIDEGRLIELKDNYRSSPDIVNFNNRFFEDLIAQQDDYIKTIYSSYEQVPKKDFPGYLEFNMLEAKDKELQPNYILDVVNRCLKQGYALQDICVLVKRNVEGSMIASTLTSNDIPVISQDSLHVGKDRTVRFMFNLIAALVYQHNSNYSKKTLEHYEELIDQNGSSELILKILQEEKIDLKKWLKENNFELKPIEHFHSFYEFAEHLIEVFDLDFSNNTYLQFFLEQIHQFEKQHSTDIPGFIEWFNDKGSTSSIQSPEGADAVNIMTIHKAKGLEFPVVICAFFDWSISGNDSPKWVIDEDDILPAYFLKSTDNTKKTKYKELLEKEDHKARLDHLNLIYVALTRPKTALFVVGNKNSHNHGPSRNWLHPFLEKELSLGRCAKDLFYTFGTLPVAHHVEKKKVNNYQVQFIKQVKDKPTLSVKNGESWDVNEMDKKRAYGNQLHLLLSRIKSANESSNEVEKLIRKGEIDEVNKESLLSDVERLFKNDRFAYYFDSNKVKNEVALIDEVGNKHIPDKLIYEGNTLLVVDFKTGKEDKAKHEKQVKEYIQILQKMESLPVKGELFYTEDEQITLVGSE
ncbi:MAG: UvrD-helicase domain-containing protein [Crocinitomicaceae bacterium]|nr:UvrD-helicase domain-containing protein [Crocinitomicaceae bacterium]